ncbi:MAG: uracil-DNA glycosylase family protein, partial [Pseudomonadota bacterium]
GLEQTIAAFVWRGRRRGLIVGVAREGGNEERGGGEQDKYRNIVNSVMQLEHDIKACRLCAAQFLDTHTAHEPRPVTGLSTHAPILIAGQAPGMRVHQSGRFFTDPSGDRLRDWLGVSEEEFYNPMNFAILPMAFCFPGYTAKGADLPPPKICAATWRAQALEAMPQIQMAVLIGGYAQAWHLGKMGLTARVSEWRDHAPQVFPLPHPSWRNNGWLKKHPWFEAELLPELRKKVTELIR